jgi:hypothetical protein
MPCACAQSSASMTSPGEAHRLFYRELALTLQALPQVLTFHVRHGIPQEPGRFPGVKNWQDVWVVQPGSRADLAQEALRS